MSSVDGMMCPNCGILVRVRKDGLTWAHNAWGWKDGTPCPGGGQHPRYAYSDARPLWNGEPNRLFRG